jgi:hypothetical protein
LKLYSSILIALTVLLATVHADVREWLTSSYEVTKVFGGDRFFLNFNGMNLAVRLVSVKVNDQDGATKYLQKGYNLHMPSLKKVVQRFLSTKN